MVWHSAKMPLNKSVLPTPNRQLALTELCSVRAFVVFAIAVFVRVFANVAITGANDVDVMTYGKTGQAETTTIPPRIPRKLRMG